MNETTRKMANKTRDTADSLLMAILLIMISDLIKKTPPHVVKRRFHLKSDAEFFFFSIIYVHSVEKKSFEITRRTCPNRQMKLSLVTKT